MLNRKHIVSKLELLCPLCKNIPSVIIPAMLSSMLHQVAALWIKSAIREKGIRSSMLATVFNWLDREKFLCNIARLAGNRTQ
jgi:hypothetical protein